MILFFFNDTATTEIYTLSLHDALPISQEYPIAAMRQRVERDHVARALLEQQQISRVLAAGVVAMAVATDVVVEPVVDDGVVRRTIQTDAEPRVERKVVTANREAVAAHQHQTVHAMLDGVVTHVPAFDVLQIHRRAKPQPLALLVVMK